MAPTVELIRHGEAWNNIYPRHNIIDPALTENGVKQCQALAQELAEVNKNTICVIASPMRRTIQTALAAFDSYIKSGGKIFLIPDLQELGSTGSEIGSTREELQATFGTDSIEYSFMEPNWNDKSPNSRYHPEHIQLRAQAVRLLVRAIVQNYRYKEGHVCIVSHGNFNQFLTLHKGRVFRNAEWRSYDFEVLTGQDIDAELHETDDSRFRRNPYMHKAQKPVLQLAAAADRDRVRQNLETVSSIMRYVTMSNASAAAYGVATIDTIMPNAQQQSAQGLFALVPADPNNGFMNPQAFYNQQSLMNPANYAAQNTFPDNGLMKTPASNARATQTLVYQPAMSQANYSSQTPFENYNLNNPQASNNQVAQPPANKSNLNPAAPPFAFYNNQTDPQNSTL